MNGKPVPREKRSVQTNVHLTRSERDALEKFAEEMHASVAGAARHLILRGLQAHRPSSTEGK